MNHFGLFISFTAVVEHGSFTAAAKHLGKTKGIVSRQVGQLESLLDTRLLNRTTRAIAVTEQGREVYSRARHIIDEVEKLENFHHTNEEHLYGRLKVSAPKTFGEANLMTILPQFMRQHPHLRIELQFTDRYIDIVDEGFDLALRIGNLNDSTLVAKKLGSFEQKVVASPEFIHQYPTITTPHALTSLPCIYDSNRRDGKKWILTHQGKSHSVKIQPVLTVNSALAASIAAQQGLGATLLPVFAMQQALKNDRLIDLFPNYSLDSIGFYALYPHRQHLAKKVTLFIDYLSLHIADILQ